MLLGDGFRAPQVRAPSHKTAPTPDASTDSVCLLSFGLAGFPSQGFSNPLRFDDLLKWLTELGKRVHWSVIQGVRKDADEQADGRDAEGKARGWGGGGAGTPTWAHPLPSTSTCSPTHDLSTPVLREFIWRLPHGAVIGH